MEKMTRKEQKERTRAGLVQEALSLFAKNGIGATTTAHVAQALDVSHGTVFIHFPTREELITAVVDRFGEALSAELGQCLSDEMSLRELLKAHLHVLSKYEDFYLRLISESQTLPPGVRSLVYAMNASISYRLHRAAQKLMKEGEIKKMDQASLFTTWMSLLHYHIMNRDLLSDKTPILEHEGGEILKLFLTLIKKEEK
jgi:AcrR family transcriptional regulator